MNNLEKDKSLNEEVQDDQAKKSESKKAVKHSKRRRKRGFFGMLSYIADCIAKALQNGFLGFLFIDLYVKLNNVWKKSVIYRVFALGRRKSRSNATFAHLYEKTQINRVIMHIGNIFVNTYERVFGILLFSFACSSIGMSILKYQLSPTNIQPAIITSIIIAFLSLPLVVSRKKVGEAFLERKLGRFIVHQLLSLDESKLEIDEAFSGISYLGAFETGMLIGFMTYLVEPWIIAVIALLMLIVVVIMCFPELGIMITFMVIPFTNVFVHSSLTILALICVTFLSFILKFIRGKRVMRFELIDFVVLLFGAMLLISGLYTNGGTDSVLSTWVYLGFLSIYVLIVNSYIRKTWIYRGIKLISVITAIVSVLAMINGGIEDASWVDFTVFPQMGKRLASFFDNPNMLGVYLVLVLPFALANMIKSQKIISKGLYFVCFALILSCALLTQSRSAWIGIIASLIVFFVTYNFRSIWLVLTGGAGLMTALYFVLPRETVNRFLSIFVAEYRDSSIDYRISIWTHIFPENNPLVNILANPFGIGMGEKAFWSVFPIFNPNNGELAAYHSHNLAIQLLLEIGIIGLLIFTIIMIMFAQKCFGAFKERRRGSKSRTMIAAGLAGVCGMLVAGISDYVFYNYRVFLMFWIVVALTVSLTKINEREQFKSLEAVKVDSNSRSAELELQY